jgi:hypothetical protein
MEHQCGYEALSYLWSVVQEWGFGNHVSNIISDCIMLTSLYSTPDSDVGRHHDAQDDTSSLGRSAGADSGLLSHERHGPSDAVYKKNLRFGLVSLSTIINRIIGRIQQLEASEISAGKLHSECTRIKGLLEALKCACDKSSCLEYFLFLAL